MASLDSLRMKYYAASGVVRQVVDDTPVAIRLRNVAGGAVTSVTVDNTAETLVIITANGGTDSYAIGTAGTNTVGGLIAAINGDGIFQAMAVDSLLADSVDDKLIDGAVTAGVDSNGVTVWDLKTDTSALAELTVGLGPQLPDWDLPAGHRVHLQEIVYNADLTAAADKVQIWRRKKGVETKIYSALSVDTTATTINFASGQGKISGGIDDVLVVKITGTVVDAAANFLRVIGTVE